MTNYNERLDKIIISFAGAIRKEVLALGSDDPSYDVQPLFSPAKQALTSLIKELVAEAKPTRSETQRGGVTVYGDLSERDFNIINQYEQNLLKALEVNSEA